jgi:hypothetical protein
MPREVREKLKGLAKCQCLMLTIYTPVSLTETVQTVFNGWPNNELVPN